MNESFRERFKQFTKPDYSSRVVPESSIPLYIGVDSDMRYLIEYHGKFAPKKIASTSAIEVNQYRNKEYNTLRFTLTNEEVSGLFFIFCEDILEMMSNLQDQNQGYQSISNRFSQWKQMFVSSKKKKLKEQEIMGLIGEILFMRGWLAQQYGLSEALKAWSGQELTHKDFSVNDTWYEIKAVTRGKPTVRIASLEQLDSETTGFLVVYPFEKMSEEYNGISLNSIVVETLKVFPNAEDAELFKRKIALQGYEYSNYYDNYVFVVGDPKHYKIDDDFPRLTRKDVPVSVANCIYDLLLRDLERFVVQEG